MTDLTSPYLSNRQIKASIRELRRRRETRLDTFDLAALQLDVLRKNAIKSGALPVGKVFRQPTAEAIELRRRIMMWYARGKGYRPPSSSAKDDVE